jgi:HSP20 family protein
VADGLAGWTGHLFTGRGELTHSGSHPMFASRPAVDISEARKSYRVRVDLPGIEKEDLSVTVEGNTLAVFAHRREEADEEGEGRHWIETSYGATRRILSLPEDADTESIRAQFRNGVLDIRIGKHPTRVRSTREVEIATD